MQKRLPSPLTRAFLERVVGHFGLDGGIWDLEDYYAVEGVEQDARRLCIRYALRPPFAGTIRACIPASLDSVKGLRNPRPDEIVLSGDLNPRPGIIGYPTHAPPALRACESLATIGAAKPERKSRLRKLVGYRLRGRMAVPACQLRGASL